MIRQEVEHAKLAWSSFRAMLGAAAHNPLWAFVHVILSPFQALRILKRVFLLPLVVLAVFIVGFALLMDHIGIQGTWLSRLVYGLCFPIPLLIAFRAAAWPMISNFGGLANDGVHGTARFATSEEVTALSKGKTGLLLGRYPHYARVPAL